MTGEGSKLHVGVPALVSKSIFLEERTVLPCFTEFVCGQGLVGARTPKG